MKNEKGQVLAGVIALLLVLAIIVPVMVKYVQNEAKWSVKQTQNSNAFQLAEAAVDRGYQKVTESSATWNSIQAGTMPTGYKFDTAYTELTGGSYAISISSGPNAKEVTIIGIGRDKGNREVRALRVVFVNTPLGGNAITSANSAMITGTNNVEWGSVASNQSISIGASINHPQFYSASSIPGKDSNGSSPPNTNSLQWWSYYSNIPTTPYLDFDFYRSSAIATGTCISETTTGIYTGCLNSGINACGSSAWAGGGDHECTSGTQKACKGYTWYFNCPTNGITFTSNNNTYLIGTVIVIGNLATEASAASGNYNASLPQTAWKQYGSDWAWYTGSFTLGGACANLSAPGTFPGLTSSYLSPSNATCPLAQVLVHGFLYVSGNAIFGTNGSGNTIIHGSSYMVGNASVTAAGFRVFHDPTVAQNLVTTRIVLTRQSWADVVRGWPAALP